MAFVFVFLALTLIATTISNSWGQTSIVVGLVTLGLAQGCIVALVFNKLLMSVDKGLAGDVGAFRGLTHNISGSAGIAVATAIAVSTLGLFVVRDVAASPVFTDQLVREVNLDNADFITNDQLKSVLEQTAASPAEIDAAVEVLSDARLDALQLTLMLLAALSLLALVPAGGMPDFREADLTVEDEEGIASGTRSA